MKTRFAIKQVAPGSYRALNALDEFMETTPLDPLHKELIKIRASQLNGCAYCVNSHTQDAQKLGETEQRLRLLCVWREAHGFFSEEEQILLAITEEITLIHQCGLSEETYRKAVDVLGEQKTAAAIMGVITINAWNRIGVSLRMQINA
jgi:AhpD family alkylhydroperoxidase